MAAKKKGRAQKGKQTAKEGKPREAQDRSVDAAKTRKAAPAPAQTRDPEKAQRTGRRQRPKGTTLAGRRHRRFNRIGALVIVGVLLLFITPFIVNAIQRANLPGEHVPSLGHAHIQEGSPTPEYNSNPPTSGPHYAGLAPAGSYDHELPDPLLVHNMEDGYVILWYRMGDAEHNRARIAELEEAARGYSMVVIAPRENLDSEYALTAWQRIDRFDEYDPERVRRFLEAFHGIDNHPRAGF